MSGEVKETLCSTCNKRKVLCEECGKKFSKPKDWICAWCKKRYETEKEAFNCWLSHGRGDTV